MRPGEREKPALSRGKECPETFEEARFAFSSADKDFEAGTDGKAIPGSDVGEIKSR